MDFPPIRRFVSQSAQLLCAGLVFLMVQGCSEPLSVVQELLRTQGNGDARQDIPVDASIEVTEDGKVIAWGPVQETSGSHLGLADVTFRVTERTEVVDVAGKSMALSDVAMGTFFQVDGLVADDGEYEAVAARADSTEVVCHVPPGNPDNAHTISVGSRAMAAHLKHGDVEGECEGQPAGEGSDDSEDVESDDPDEEKVLVCHLPPGNPENAHTLTIGLSSLQDHLDHGDTEGACEE